MSKKLHCVYCGKFLAIIEEGKISPKLIPVCEHCNSIRSNGINNYYEMKEKYNHIFDTDLFNGIFKGFK
jgi:hypothetical protein